MRSVIAWKESILILSRGQVEGIIEEDIGGVPAKRACNYGPIQMASLTEEVTDGRWALMLSASC
jgi:hypothetical protein